MIFNKIKWFLAIAMVFFLILATNLIDQKSFRQAHNSVVKIYEDRLLTKNVVFELSILFQEKAIAHALGDTSFYAKRYQEVTAEIDAWIQHLNESNLTREEKNTVSGLETAIIQLRREEKRFLDDLKDGETDYDRAILQDKMVTIRKKLSNLAETQIREGKRQMTASQNALDSVELLTQLELYLLLILAVTIQIIVLYRPRKREETSED